MISLGKFEGYILAVNQSNVEPDKVTYRLIRDGEDLAYCREDAICSPIWGESPDDYLYVEAARRYDAMDRPEPGEFDLDFVKEQK